MFICSSSGMPSASTPLESPPSQWQCPCHHSRQWANSRQYKPAETTPPASTSTIPPACSQRHLGLDINNSGVLSALSGSAQSQQRHIVKIREPSVSFNFAESQQKMSLEHNKGIDATGNWHREHAGQLALSMITSLAKDAKEGAKSPATCTISV